MSSSFCVILQTKWSNQQINRVVMSYCTSCAHGWLSRADYWHKHPQQSQCTTLSVTLLPETLWVPEIVCGHGECPGMTPPPPPPSFCCPFSCQNRSRPGVGGGTENGGWPAGCGLRMDNVCSVQCVLEYKRAFRRPVANFESKCHSSFW